MRDPGDPAAVQVGAVGMTAPRFREVLVQFGWSQGFIIRLLERDDRMVRRWYSGAMDIPPEVGDWLEVQAAHPPPRRVRRRDAPDRDYGS